MTCNLGDIQVANNGTVHLHRHGLAFEKRERRSGVGREVTLADRAGEHLDGPQLGAHDSVDGELVVSAVNLSTEQLDLAVPQPALLGCLLELVGGPAEPARLPLRTLNHA